MNIYNEYKQAEKGKLQNVYIWSRKGAAGSEMELNPVFEEDKQILKIVVLNKLKEIRASEQDSHLTKLPV